MSKGFPLLFGMSMIILVSSCSKKVHPSPTSVQKPVEKTAPVVVADLPADTAAIGKKVDTVAVAKPVIKKKKVKESVPKVIVVNDKYASRSVDGRLFYDLQGHRYWRNNKDGKYYLFNKSMLNDDAFRKPQ